MQDAATSSLEVREFGYEQLGMAASIVEGGDVIISGGTIGQLSYSNLGAP
jgi:hypothetical protein